MTWEWAQAHRMDLGSCQEPGCPLPAQVVWRYSWEDRVHVQCISHAPEDCRPPQEAPWPAVS